MMELMRPMELSYSEKALMIFCLLAGCYVLVCWIGIFRRKHQAKKQKEEEEIREQIRAELEKAQKGDTSPAYYNPYTEAMCKASIKELEQNMQMFEALKQMREATGLDKDFF